MMFNQFWVLKKLTAQMPDINPIFESESIFIIELTEDGNGYYWPILPRVIDTENNQDPDAYGIDGECIEAGGYFHSIADFMSCYQLDAADFKIYDLGIHPHIASARALWQLQCSEVS